MERNLAERERSGERAKSAAPATAPVGIFLFSLYVTRINHINRQLALYYTDVGTDDFNVIYFYFLAAFRPGRDTKLKSTTKTSLSHNTIKPCP